MIRRLEKFSEEEEILEGVFKSKIFLSDDSDELTIYLENGNIIKYSEKCIEHFNNIPNSMVDTICENIIKCFKIFGGENKNFKLPQLENNRDILKYCWFFSMTIEQPQTNEIAYTVNGEGDWGECISFTIRNDSIIYVGYQEVSPWENDDFYKSLEDNCIYLEV